MHSLIFDAKLAVKDELKTELPLSLLKIYIKQKSTERQEKYLNECTLLAS